MNMKSNEIGHFPWREGRHEFDKGGYDRTYFALDSKGKTIMQNDRIVYQPCFKLLGEVESIRLPKRNFDELLVDLQTCHDCFCADKVTVGDWSYIFLQGSGWAELGFPFHDDTFNPEDPYEIGKGWYADIHGKAADKFIKIAKQDGIPDFKAITTGDIKRDFIRAIAETT